MAQPSDRLNTPGRRTSWFPRVRLPEDAFGAFAEGFARFMGTANFLFWMTVFIAAWIVINNVAPGLLHDPFPYIFLTLMLSLTGGCCCSSWTSTRCRLLPAFR